VATFSLILIIASLVLFLIDAFVSTGWRVNLQSLGLACLVGAILLGGWVANLT
jgi:hypothetical protein